jgi:hypothetical protein
MITSFPLRRAPLSGRPRPYLLFALLLAPLLGLLPATARADVISYPVLIEVEVRVFGEFLADDGEYIPVDETYALTGTGTVDYSEAFLPGWGTYQDYTAVNFSATGAAGVSASGAVSFSFDPFSPHSLPYSELDLVSPLGHFAFLSRFGGLSNASPTGTVYFDGFGNDGGGTTDFEGPPGHWWEVSFSGTATAIPPIETPEPEPALVLLAGSLALSVRRLSRAA